MLMQTMVGRRNVAGVWNTLFRDELGQECGVDDVQLLLWRDVLYKGREDPTMTAWSLPRAGKSVDCVVPSNVSEGSSSSETYRRVFLVLTAT